MKAQFQDAGYKASTLTVIPPPINTQEIKRQSFEPLDNPWLDKSKSDREIPVIFAVQKNYPDLLEAFANMQDQCPSRLIILGTGSEDVTAQIKQLVKNYGLEARVDLVGFSANPFQYMHHCDVLALSSNWEGFGIVVAEALACGLTVASYDCPEGPKEILENGAYGYMAKLRDPTDLARALIAAIEKPFDSEILVQRAAQYDSVPIAAKYRSLMKSLNLG